MKAESSVDFRIQVDFLFFLTNFVPGQVKIRLPTSRGCRPYSSLFQNIEMCVSLQAYNMPKNMIFNTQKVNFEIWPPFLEH